MRSSRRLEFTAEAETDLQSLLDHTLDRWGERQQQEYARRLNEAIGRLQAHPELGSSRDDIAPGLRHLRVGRHVIFYRVLPATIRITRILHARMNPATHLLEPPGGE
jgi:toxin ParE1/3/4